MKIYDCVVGNADRKEWRDLLDGAEVDYIELDQWDAQKSRLTAVSDGGEIYAISLARGVRLRDGDILSYSPERRKATVVRLKLNDVLAIDMSALLSEPTAEAIRTAVEVGHAIGNQHWPAVVKGTKIYVPLTVDRKVMTSVMQTHGIDRITYSFMRGDEVIPYLAPHEARRLFGGAEHHSHTTHSADEHEHA